MLLTELDGFLTGLLICPEPVPQVEWMTVIWGTDADGIPAFEDPLDVQWFANAVAARQAEIARDLARGKFQPIFDVDDRDGEVLWEYWVDGFAAAIALRPEAWATLADDPNRAVPWSRVNTLIAVAHNESDLDSVEVNALQDTAPTELIEAVERLYIPDGRVAGTTSDTVPPRTALKVGRNDPCPCGSGKKHKRCCG